MKASIGSTDKITKITTSLVTQKPFVQVGLSLTFSQPDFLVKTILIIQGGHKGNSLIKKERTGWTEHARANDIEFVPASRRRLLCPNEWNQNS